MYRRGTIAAVAAMTVIAMVFVVMALNRESSLTTAAAVVPPPFPPAISATSVPLVTSSATSSSTPSASATSSASASAASSAPALPIVAFLGDDITGGVGATSNAVRWTSLVAADLGWTEKNFGFGGTGYSTGGTLAGGAPYTARIAALAATAPSIVIVAGGRFDIESPNGPTKIKAGVTATFTALRAALPNATIIAESPLWPLPKTPATLALIAADVKAAVAAVHGRYLDIGQPLFGLAADVGLHSLPNDAGYAVLAKAFETAYRS
jgi:lysophospholipase L1-like esterase